MATEAVVPELLDNLIHRFNIGDALRRRAARHPQRRALHFLGREMKRVLRQQLEAEPAGLVKGA